MAEVSSEKDAQRTTLMIPQSKGDLRVGSMPSFGTTNGILNETTHSILENYLNMNVALQLTSTKKHAQQHHHQHHHQQQQQQPNFRLGLAGNSHGLLQDEISAAAIFFVRAAQKISIHSLSSGGRRRPPNALDQRAPVHHGAAASHFAGVLQTSFPPTPPALMRNLMKKESSGIGKTKVMLRVHKDAQGRESGSQAFFNVDKRKKQVTLYDPAVSAAYDSAALPTVSPSSPSLEGGGGSNSSSRRIGVSAPKMFAFDAVFSEDDSLSEICGSALTDVIHAVMTGSDGCVLTFGHSGLGKTYTMLGHPESSATLGVIPSAISWLFRAIGDQKQHAGTRFSVRVSALEISGPEETTRDLLSGFEKDAEESPGTYLDALYGVQLQHCNELRAPTAERAGYYLDAALAAREPSPTSHMLYTIHLYQYNADRCGGGGRSRLHLLDLAGGDRQGKTGLPLSSIGNIILGIFNGQRHFPHKDSRLAALLRNVLSSLTCQVSMLIHVSPLTSRYTETLSVVQLASRIHRMRARRARAGFFGNRDDLLHARQRAARVAEESSPKSSSEVDPSSSEQSCDTVIYMGPADDPTDGEQPPSSRGPGDRIPWTAAAATAKLGGGAADAFPAKAPASGAFGPSGRDPAKERSCCCPSSSSSPTKRPPVPPPLPPPPATPGPPRSSSPPSSSSSSSSSDCCRSRERSADLPRGSLLAQSRRHLRSEKDREQRSPHLSRRSPPASKVKASDEEWIDGPRFSKLKVAEGRRLKISKQEMWVDGPSRPASSSVQQANVKNVQAMYAYMDDHKKLMIERWVETHAQHAEIPAEIWIDGMNGGADLPRKDIETAAKDDPSSEVADRSSKNGPEDLTCRTAEVRGTAAEESREGASSAVGTDHDGRETQGSSKEVSIPLVVEAAQEKWHPEGQRWDDEVFETIEVPERDEPIPMTDSSAQVGSVRSRPFTRGRGQVTEEDICRCMAKLTMRRPSCETTEDMFDHPLRILSEENLTVASTFTDPYSMREGEGDDSSNPFDDIPDYKQLYDLSISKNEEYFAKRFHYADEVIRHPYVSKEATKVPLRCESASLNQMLFGGVGGPCVPSQNLVCSSCKSSILRAGPQDKPVACPQETPSSLAPASQPTSLVAAPEAAGAVGREENSASPAAVATASTAPQGGGTRRQDQPGGSLGRAEPRSGHAKVACPHLAASTGYQPEVAADSSLSKEPGPAHVYENPESWTKAAKRIPGSVSEEKDAFRDPPSPISRVDSDKDFLRKNKNSSPSKSEKVRIGKFSRILRSPARDCSSARKSSRTKVYEGHSDCPSHESCPAVADLPKPYKVSSSAPTTPQRQPRKSYRPNLAEENPISYQPPWHQQHSQNKNAFPCDTCSPSLETESYESENDSGVVARVHRGVRVNTSAKELKGVIHSPSLLCESSGYESVGMLRDSECNSLISSQDSEQADHHSSPSAAVSVPPDGVQAKRKTSVKYWLSNCYGKSTAAESTT